MMETQTLDEFKKKCAKEDYNVISEWDVKRFKVICSDCGSDDVLVFFREEKGYNGSEYTGYMRGLIHKEGIIVKCKNCGKAITIGLPTN